MITILKVYLTLKSKLKKKKKGKKTDKKHFGTNVTNKYFFFFQAKAVFQQYIWQNLEYKKEAG